MVRLGPFREIDYDVVKAVFNARVVHREFNSIFTGVVTILLSS